MNETLWVIATIFLLVFLPAMIVRWMDKRSAEEIEKILKEFRGKN